ncbi:hypothetical protein IM40_06180 [Candidatus Paracaedimonas acanthamoebae]|nr:hypothetical protein IM40_06180 [Candidatus Paracaedimonas acanthamoebae]
MIRNKKLLNDELQEYHTRRHPREGGDLRSSEDVNRHQKALGMWGRHGPERGKLFWSFRKTKVIDTLVVLFRAQKKKIVEENVSHWLKFFFDSKKLPKLILSVVSILSFTPQLYASVSDFNEDDKDLKKLEAFLGKNKVSMEKVGHGRYKVNDDQFKEIFPSTSLIENNFQGSVGFIENEFFDPLGGKTVINAGTGTIIENNTDTIKVLTAAHVVQEKGTITFTMDSVLTMPGNSLITHLALYTAKRVFIHNTEDLAYIECELTTPVIEKTKLASYSMPRDHQEITIKRKVTIFHYPYGVEGQRINQGFITPGNQNHTIPTLGGSSGVSIVYQGKDDRHSHKRWRGEGRNYRI